MDGVGDTKLLVQAPVVQLPPAPQSAFAAHGLPGVGPPTQEPQVAATVQVVPMCGPVVQRRPPADPLLPWVQTPALQDRMQSSSVTHASPIASPGMVQVPLTQSAAPALVPNVTPLVFSVSQRSPRPSVSMSA